MDRNELFKKIELSEQRKAYSDTFMIRRSGSGEGEIYYISTTNGPHMVEGTPEFDTWGEAKFYLNNNWQRLFDEVFEKEVLGGSEQD